MSKELVKKKFGPPAVFNKVSKDEFLDHVADGGSLRSFAKKAGMSTRTLYRHFESDPEFKDQYSIARMVRADVLVDDMLEIMSDYSSDYYVDKNGNKQQNMIKLFRDRGRVDVIKFMASKLNNKYEKGPMIQQNIHIEGGLTIDQRLEKLREYAKKANFDLKGLNDADNGAGSY